MEKASILLAALSRADVGQLLPSHPAFVLSHCSVASEASDAINNIYIYIYINMYIYIYIIDCLSAKNPSSLIYVRKVFPFITQKSCGDCEASEDLLQSHPAVVLSQRSVASDASDTGNNIYLYMIIYMNILIYKHIKTDINLC